MHSGGDEIRRSWTERRQTDPRLTRQPSIRRRHKARGLLMARDDQADAGFTKRFQQVQVLFAGDAKDARDTFALKSFHQ